MYIYTYNVLYNAVCLTIRYKLPITPSLYNNVMTITPSLFNNVMTRASLGIKYAHRRKNKRRKTGKQTPRRSRQRLATATAPPVATTTKVLNSEKASPKRRL
jgi:hypothetical protein